MYWWEMETTHLQSKSCIFWNVSSESKTASRHLMQIIGDNHQSVHQSGYIITSQWVTHSANKQKDPCSIPEGDTNRFVVVSGMTSNVQKSAKANMQSYPLCWPLNTEQVKAALILTQVPVLLSQTASSSLLTVNTALCRGRGGLYWKWDCKTLWWCAN